MIARPLRFLRARDGAVGAVVGIIDTEWVWICYADGTYPGRLRDYEEINEGS